MFSFSNLRTFLEVARLGSVQEAADALIISQPAVSSAIAALQRGVGAKLTERDGRGIRLTEAGKAFESSARRIVAMLEDAQRQAQEVAQIGASRLRIAAVTTAAEHLVPNMLHNFRLQQPETFVELDVGNHMHMWNRLRHWEVDLVVAGRPPHDMPLHSVATRAHELIVIAPADDSFALLPLGQATWLVRESGSGTRAATEDLFAALGIDPPRLTIVSNGAIGACVRVGLGYSLVSRDSVMRELEAGTLRQVETPVTPLNRRWHLIVAADRDMSLSVKRFVSFAIENCDFLSNEQTGLK